ncbi:hypothetical protein EUX98_g2543 [Antrodiella citrinella]|uniref:Uncharacterized protein n=1 Tax=Antrodiella citrinella TaxID=2447956 RepID=A0A4S4N0Z0_9APHY|nr:hypothetical protein EUX98_g2543 [Antrodiella citrinella]
MASSAASHTLAFDMQWASIALLGYDYCLTFPMEQTLCIWLLQLAGYTKGRMSPDYGVRVPQASQFDHLLTILMVVFESSAAILTIIRSIQAFKAGGSSWRLWKEGLSYMIFEEGILYFCVISVFTTATLILIYHEPPNSNSRILNSLTLPLSGMFTARFLLHIRHWKHKRSLGNLPADLQLDSSLAISSLEFQRESQSDMMSYLANDFGSDPVARMAATPPDRDGPFHTLPSPGLDEDEAWEVELRKEEDDGTTLSSPMSNEFSLGSSGSGSRHRDSMV